MSGSATAYFDRRMVNRERLFWTVATRRQLERWEPLFAESVRRRHDDRQLDDSDIWAAQIEHHFALIAGGHLLQALELDPASNVSLDPTLRAELKEGRDLHEHWQDNLAVFNVTPRVEQPPRKSGRDFAARNPDQSPYWWLGWSPKKGAKLLPHVSAPELHKVLDAVEDEVLADDSELARFVPVHQPSPWVYENGEWWPA
jgi:hypothetical protein